MRKRSAVAETPAQDATTTMTRGEAEKQLDTTLGEIEKLTGKKIDRDGTAPRGAVAPPPAAAVKSFVDSKLPAGRPLDPAYDKIVETILVNDPVDVYQRLEKDLAVGAQRSDYGTLMKAADEAETNARMAHRLFITSKIEQDAWEHDNAPVLGAMREAATHELQREKESGARTKQITEGDIEGKMAAMYHDEWSTQQARRRRMKSVVETAQHLAETWASRCRTLQTMVSKLRT